MSGAGTGGTIAGVSRYLKARDPRIRVRCACTPLSAIIGKLSGLLSSKAAASWDPGSAFEEVGAEPTRLCIVGKTSLPSEEVAAVLQRQHGMRLSAQHQWPHYTD